MIQRFLATMSGPHLHLLLAHTRDVSETVIERHEDAAEYAFIATLVLGLSSLAGILLTLRREVPRWLTGALLVMALVVAAMLAYTANLGGQIDHPEIRSEATIEHPFGPVTSRHEAARDGHATSLL